MELNLCVSEVPLGQWEKCSWVLSEGGSKASVQFPFRVGAGSYSISLLVVHRVWGPHSLGHVGECRRVGQKAPSHHESQEHKRAKKPRGGFYFLSSVTTFLFILGCCLAVILYSFLISFSLIIYGQCTVFPLLVWNLYTLFISF